MSKHSIRIAALIGTVLVVCAFAPEPATAQGMSTLAPAIGTMWKYEGMMATQEGQCWPKVPYEQYEKIAGHVILPETEAKVFYFIEYWGRDEGTMPLRLSPNGDAILYYHGVEQIAGIRGPVGTYFDFTDPESGETLRYQIVQDGITLTVPAGTYSNVARMDVSCTSCGQNPVLVEIHWLSPEVAVPIQFAEWNAPNQCVPRWHELVSVTRK
ncbi:MAG: hypothetical protein H6Q86_2128 [candidate division NC10 bacterium]|jgi:hypothetical protein|nr:hypothetical protein [candidate division NC10 bacterium]